MLSKFKLNLKFISDGRFRMRFRAADLNLRATARNVSPVSQLSWSIEVVVSSRAAKKTKDAALA